MKRRDALAATTMTVCDALRLLLAVEGSDVPRRLLAEALEDDASPEAASEVLRRSGWPARVVRLAPLDLRHLAAPTLLFFEEGRAAVLVGVGHRHAVLLDSAGHRSQVSFAALAAAWRGVAIERVIATSPATRPGAFMRDAAAGLGAPFGFVGAASVALLLLALAVPLGTQQVIDWALPDGAPGLLASIAVALFVIGIFQALLGYARERAIAYLECRLGERVQRGMLERMLALPFSLVQTRRPGDEVQLLTSAQAVAQSVTQLVLGPAIDGALGVVYLVLLIYWLPLAGWIAAGLLLVTVVIALRVGRRQASLQREELGAQGIQNDRLLEILDGIATVKVGADAREALAGWMARLARERVPGLERQRSGLVLEGTLDVARHGCLVAVLLVGGKAALEGGLTVGTLLATIQISHALWEAVAKLGDGWLKLSLVLPHLERLEPTLAAPRAPAALPRSSERRRGVAVVLDKVRFRHAPGAPWILLDYDLAVQPGQHLQLRGRSGAGKTTILRLLAGLYEPEQGMVSVGGFAPAAARHLVSYVPQDTIICNGSILENLRLLSGRAPRHRLLEAAAATGLDDFVRTLPMGYETILPPGGATLSGGQRQLIALSACIASDRPVLLLDEAMSHLDGVSRARVAGSRVFEGRTVISVVHDEVTVAPEETARVPCRNDSAATRAAALS